MNRDEPLVSVTLITFNHEKYIGQAIQSVLDQTHRDFELVIVNDGSTDATAQIIDRFSDPRMRVFTQENQGPSMAANRALAECRGRYLAIMAGDDLVPPNRIERQLNEYLKGDSRILFSQFDMIDEEGASIETNRYESNRTPAHGRAKVLRRLFEGSAPAMCLTLFTETRICHEERVFCAPGLYQLQDFDYMVRFAKKYDFVYVEESLYHYRMRRGQLNLSGSDPYKLIRTHNEFYLLMRRFFDGISIDLFKEIFPDLVRDPNFTTLLEYQCEQAFIWLESPNRCLRLFGVEKLYELLHQKEASAVLTEKYGFTHKSLADTTKNLDVMSHYPDRSTLYLSRGSDYTDVVSIQSPANRVHEEFALSFDLSGVGPVRGIRWNPVEGCYSRVQIREINYWDATGIMKSVDLDRLESNGQLLADGSYQFLTIAPLFFLPIEGDVAGMVIQGRWWSPLGGKGERYRHTTLYLNDGQHFGEDTALRKAVCLETEEFSLTFELAGKSVLRALRWDPVEGDFCRVRLESVSYRDALGKVHSINPIQITSNGTLLTSGAHLFDTTDPMFFLPIEGEIDSVTIQGRWNGPLSRAAVEEQKTFDRTARERFPWVRRLLKNGVRQLRDLKRKTLPTKFLS